MVLAFAALGGCAPRSPGPAADGSSGGPAERGSGEPATAVAEKPLLNVEREAGKLYVTVRGDQLVVGVRDRFELVFEQGLIAAWHTGNDENLAAAPGLGPYAIVAAAAEGGAAAAGAGDDEPAVVGGGAEVLRDLERAAPRARQTVLEASPFRVIVAVVRPQSAAASGDPPSEPADGWAACAYQYTVYPDGRVYLRLLCAARPHEAHQATYALGVALAPRSGFRLLPPPPVAVETPPRDFVLLTRGRTAPAALFWTAAAPGVVSDARLVLLREDEPLLVTAGHWSAAPPLDTAHLLCFWPRELRDAGEGEREALAYQHPARLRVTVGRVVRDAPGDLNRDGFNESQGCYELALARGTLRFRFEPADVPRDSPRFRVHGSAGQRCWVYADGQALPADARDAEGRLLFALPGVIQRPRSLEVVGGR